jgi:hypothetical protein
MGNGWYGILALLRRDGTPEDQFKGVLRFKSHHIRLLR